MLRRFLGPRGQFVDLGCTAPEARLRASGSTYCCASSIRCAVPTGASGSCASVGRFTAAQQALARELGLGEAIVVLPALDRSTLAASLSGGARSC